MKGIVQMKESLQLTTRTRTLLASLVLVLTAAGPAAAQGGPGLTLAGGASGYDLSGTGTTFVLGASLDVPLGAAVVLDAGGRFLRYEAQSGRHVSFLLPEAGLQAQLPLGPVRPYLGGGVGRTLVVEGPGRDELTLHAALGARIDLPGSWSLRPEFRVRSIDPWAGSTGDFTLGFTYRPW